MRVAQDSCWRWKEFGKDNKFFNTSRWKSDDVALAAESAFSFHTVKHHSVYTTVHYTSVLFKIIFPDSEIPRKFSSARTKAQETINSVIAPHTVENRMQVFKNNTVSFLLWSCHRRKQSHCSEGVSRCYPLSWLEKWWFAIKVNWSAAAIEYTSTDCCSVYQANSRKSSFADEVYFIRGW